MKRSNLLKVFFASLLMIAIVGVFSCKKKKACEENNTGGVVFWNDGPNWVWPEVYIEVDWSDGSLSDASFTNSYEFNDVPVGRAEVYATWEDDLYYYYDGGHITIKQCQMVEGFLTLGKKSVASGEYTSTKQGQVNKKDFISRKDLIQSLKIK